MGEAKVTLRIDVSEALESIRKVREGAKNVTSGGAGGGGRRSPTEQQILRLAALKKRLALQEERENLRNKLILDKIYKSQELHVIKIAALKKRLQHTEAAAEMKLNLMKQRYDINEERRLDRKNAKERRAEQERLNAIRREEREKTRIARQDAQRISRISRAGSAGIFNSTFQAGLTRLGGMGGGPVGGVLRNSVTGGFFGQSIGASAGTLFRGAGRGIGTAVGGVGGQLIGGLGAVLGTAAPVYGALKGAQIGATFTIAQAGFSAAVNVFSSAARMLAGVVSSIAGTGFRTARNLAVAGTAGAIGVTGAGIRAYGQRVGAETGLNVVGGAYAPSLMGYGNQLANAPGQMFSRTSILQGITKASAFGMSPGLIRYFMPKMMNAAAVFGEDTAEGMRALARAAFQAEPEAAERFGLNLYERNIRQMTGNKYNLNDPNQKAMAAFETAAMQLRKFQGGMQAQRRTPGGAFQYVKNQGTNLLEQIGMGFSQGFQLIPRLNQLGGIMGAGGTKGTAFGIASGVGSLLGRGADFLSRNLPGRADLGAFFSSRDEGTEWSRFGDTTKGAIASISGGLKTFMDEANRLWEKLVGDENGIFPRMQRQFQAFKKDWAGTIRELAKPLIELLDGIHKWIGETFKSILNEAMGGVPGAAKKALTSREFFTGVIGAGVGAIGGTFAAGPAGAVVGAMGGFGAGVRGGNASRMFFDKGGVVDAPEGTPVPAVVHGGEMILNRSQQKLMGIRSYAKGTIDYGGGEWGGFTGRVPLEVEKAYQPLKGETVSGKGAAAAIELAINKIADVLDKNQDKISKVSEEMSKVSESFKSKVSESRPNIDSVFDKIAGVFSAVSRAAVVTGGMGTPTNVPVGMNWAVGRGGQSAARGRVLSRLPEGFMLPGVGLPSRPMVGTDGRYGEYKDLGEIWRDAKIQGEGAGYNTGRLSKRIAGVIINHYGNTYRRGDSNDLMRLAEAV